jgi:hypothetical protein
MCLLVEIIIAHGFGEWRLRAVLSTQALTSKAGEVLLPSCTRTQSTKDSNH